MSSRKPSKPSSKPGGTTVSRTSASASSSTRLLTLDKRSSSHRLAAGTILRSDLDAKMATRQLKYETLSGQARQEQEKWAQKQLIQTTCSNGFPWVRETGGYRCTPPRHQGPGGHFVTDELITEGKNRFYYTIWIGSPKANLLLPDGSLWDEPRPKPEDYSENVREVGRKIRIDSSGRVWEADGPPTYWLRPDPQSWGQVCWKRI
jgi:hypothetical protein